jgi:hypothetical protein
MGHEKLSVGTRIVDRPAARAPKIKSNPKSQIPNPKSLSTIPELFKSAICNLQSAVASRPSI